MIVRTKAPMRLNFAGGGCDLEPYVSDYGAYVLSAAIKYYARAIRLPEYVPANELETLLSRMAGSEYIKIINDVPAMAGIGGSASCFVAGIKAIYPTLNQEQMAQLAFYLEREVMGVNGGIQDQYCAVYGGLLYLIVQGRKVEISKLNIPAGLADLLVMIYVGKREHKGDEIIKDQFTRNNIKALHRQKTLAKIMRDALIGNNFVEFGKLLDESWRVKKEFSPLVSNVEIDSLYDKCLNIGASGGCIMGAGGGGYLLIMENPQAPGELRYNLVNNNIAYSNIEFDTQGVQLE